MLSYIINAEDRPVPTKHVNVLGTPVIVNQSGVIAPGGEEVVFTTTDPVIIEELTWSTNHKNLFQIRIQPRVNGTPFPLSEPRADGSGLRDMFPEELNNNGSSFFYFMEYDTIENKYKLRFKSPLSFSEGVIISFRSIAESTDSNYACLIVGRSYD